MKTQDLEPQITRPKSWKQINGGFWKKLSIFIFQECWAWLSYWLSRWAFVKALESIAKLGLIGALAVWLWKIPERHQQAIDQQKAKHYAAWQAINSATGKRGNGGRTDALQDLNNDGVWLRSIDLSRAEFFDPITLTNSHLNNANLTEVRFFTNADFSLSQMNHAIMERGQFEDCKFGGVSFCAASFTNASFTQCDFGTMTNMGRIQLGDFYLANLCSCKFVRCSFVGSRFEFSHWNDPTFVNCNFAYADMTNIVLDSNNGSFVNCNFFGVTNASPKFTAWATNHGMIFTNINITSHQDWLAWVKKNVR